MNAVPASASSIPRFPLAPDRSRNRHEDLRAFSALGSGARVRILRSIAAEEKSIPQLARELRMHRGTLRYHLSYLRNQGLVDEVETLGPRKVGRPATRYRAASHAHVQGFPERHFDFLGQIALEAFVDAVGGKTASAFLEKKGVEVGRSMVENLRGKAEVTAWTPGAFERFVLGGLFLDFGVASEVLSRSSKTLVYRSFTCPFLELAEKMPDLICNALDSGFHRGLDEGLGGVRTDRLACMGHGDPYCEYRLVWQGQATSKFAGRRERSAKPQMEGRKGVRGRRTG